MVQSSGNQAPASEQTLLGIVFAFDVESLGPEYAFTRAWQLWMERLDPAEMRRAALYDGAIALPGLPLITVIAVSATPATVAYVREAFAAPDLAAFQGIAPASHRFLDVTQIPRERLVLRGYINDHGQFLPNQEDIPLRALAAHAGWPQQDPTSVLPKATTPPRPAPPPAPVDPATQATYAMHAVPRLDGATQVMMRLWHSTFRSDARPDQRRRIMGIGGAIIVLLGLAFLALRVSAQIASRQAQPTATPNGGANTTLVVAPLTVRLTCTPGQLAQFTIDNNGAAPLSWSSNAANYEPPLSFSDVSGDLAGGDSQVVTLTTSEAITNVHTAQLLITSPGGNATINIVFGGCPGTP